MVSMLGDPKELRAYEICSVKPQSPISSAISCSSSALWELPCAMWSTLFFLGPVEGALCNVEHHGGHNMFPRKPSSATTPHIGLKGLVVGGSLQMKLEPSRFFKAFSSYL